MKNPLTNAPFEALPKPFRLDPTPSGVQVKPAVRQLVARQVDALLSASPNYHNLSGQQQQQMRDDLIKIGAYSAALIQEDWAISKKLGQTPVLREQTIFAPLARATGATTPGSGGEPRGVSPLTPVAVQQGPPAEEFNPRAASQVARITRETLNAVAFPTFVADLIKGTFQAIVNASIQQMEAYGQLLANVAKTVDQFMAENITDNQARDYLVGRYPGHFRLEVSDNAARLRVRDRADDLPKPNWKTDLNLPEDVELDDEVAEEKLVPAARRQLAQSRHSMLSTMVLMGINRIVVTSGRIRATMGFHIDAKDHGRVETASQFDWQHDTRARFGYGGGLLGGIFGGPSGSVETRNTVAYVSSTKKDSSDDLNVSTDLTGEVELKFKSDYFPMDRFAKPEMLALIQGHTPNPAANTPTTGGGQKTAGDTAQ
jgi:hypothetical protein